MEFGCQAAQRSCCHGNGAPVCALSLRHPRSRKQQHRTYVREERRGGKEEKKMRGKEGGGRRDENTARHKVRDRVGGGGGGDCGGRERKLPHFDQLLFCCVFGFEGIACICVCVPSICVCGSHGPVDTQASHTPIPGTSTQSLTFPGLQHAHTHTQN